MCSKVFVPRVKKTETGCVPQGKVFPKLRKRSSTARLTEQDRNGEEQTAADYVFRIVYPGYRYDASE